MKNWHIVIGLAFVALIAMILTGCYSDVSPDARQFLTELQYPKDTPFTCQNSDSDGDGYVSCTARPPGEGPLSFECKSDYTLFSGCRMTMPRAPVLRVQ